MSHWLLAIDMLAGFHRINRDLRVPMVGRGDQYGVNVLSFQQFAIIEIAIPLANIFGASDAALIYIRNCDYADVIFGRALHQAADVAGPLSAATDHADADAVISAEGRGRDHACERD